MKLLFVYNADSGHLNALKDTVLKAISPETYACNLCRITYGALSMQNEWKEFIAVLPHDVTFMHRDEFLQSYSSIRAELPSLFNVDGAPRTLLSAHDMNQAESVRDLVQLVTSALSRERA